MGKHSYHAAHECAQCHGTYETERRGSTVCPSCSAGRVANVLSCNGDGPEDDVLYVDLSGRPVNAEVRDPAHGTWNPDIRKPVGVQRGSARTREPFHLPWRKGA